MFLMLGVWKNEKTVQKQTKTHETSNIIIPTLRRLRLLGLGLEFPVVNAEEPAPIKPTPLAIRI